MRVEDDARGSGILFLAAVMREDMRCEERLQRHNVGMSRVNGH
jgi:hypothetical protein